MKTLALEQLRQLVSGKTARESFPFSFLPGGITRGGITEVSGRGKTELVLRFLKENPELQVAWIERSFSAHPFAFLQQEIDLRRVLFIDGQKDLDWCIYQALRAQVFQAVIVYCEDISLRSLRRIQLQSEKSMAATIWLTNEPKSAWPVNLRLSALKSKSDLRVQLIKQRS